MNRERFIKEFRKSSMTFTQMYLLAEKIRMFDKENQTHYSAALGELLAKRDDRADEPVPFDAQIFAQCKRRQKSDRPVKLPESRSKTARDLQRALRDKRRKQEIFGVGMYTVKRQRHPGLVLPKKYSS
jgi:hypothetical protein